MFPPSINQMADDSTFQGIIGYFYATSYRSRSFSACSRIAFRPWKAKSRMRINKPRMIFSLSPFHVVLISMTHASTEKHI